MFKPTCVIRMSCRVCLSPPRTLLGRKVLCGADDVDGDDGGEDVTCNMERVRGGYHQHPLHVPTSPSLFSPSSPLTLSPSYSHILASYDPLSLLNPQSAFILFPPHHLFTLATSTSTILPPSTHSPLSGPSPSRFSHSFQTLDTYSPRRHTDG